jgi:phosphatidylglycerophosphate synthase
MPGYDNIPSFDKYISYPLAEYIVPLLHNIGLKPNDITFINIIFRLFILNDYNNNKCINKLVYFSIISHIIDSFDGHMARKYNQCSEFGSKLDIYSDFIYWILFIYLIYIKTNKKILLLFTKLLLFLYLIYFFNKKEIDKKNIINISYIEMNTPIILILFLFYYKNMK